MTTHNSWCPYWIKRRIFMCHKQWKWGEIISDLKCIKAGIEMWSKNPTTSGLAAQWIQQKAYLTISDFSSPTSLPGWCKRCHFIWGGGTPWTSQSNMTISPTLQLLLLGSVLHLGGTGMMGKVLNDFSFLFWQYLEHHTYNLRWEEQCSSPDQLNLSLSMWILQCGLESDLKWRQCCWSHLHWWSWCLERHQDLQKLDVTIEMIAASPPLLPHK